MEAEKFEHIVRDRFNGFESTAPDSVWQNIDAHLDEKKRRFGLLWWMLPLLVLAGSLGAWIYSQSTATGRIEKQNTATTMPSTSSAYQKTTVETQNGSSANERLTSVSSTQPETSPPIASSTKPSTHEPMPVVPPEGDRFREHPLPEQLPTAPMTVGDEDQELLPIGTLPLLYFSSYQPEMAPCPAYGEPPKTRFVGVRLSTFVPLSQPRLQNTGVPWSSTSFATESSSIPYNRFWEVEPYFQHRFYGRRTAISWNVAMAQHKSELVEGSAYWNEHGVSVGTGVGFDYYLEWNRFSLQAFANARWELQFNQLESSNPANYNGTPTAEPLYTSAVTSFKRNALSLEGGLQGNYHLNMRWTLFAQAAYRNYIWEQRLLEYTLLNAPQMLRMGIGVQWKL